MTPSRWFSSGICVLLLIFLPASICLTDISFLTLLVIGLYSPIFRRAVAISVRPIDTMSNHISLKSVYCNMTIAPHQAMRTAAL